MVGSGFKFQHPQQISSKEIKTRIPVFAWQFVTSIKMFSRVLHRMASGTTIYDVLQMELFLAPSSHCSA
jgi:hypothetical protein